MLTPVMARTARSMTVRWLRRRANAASSSSKLSRCSRAHPVHDEVGVALEDAHHRLQPGDAAQLGPHRLGQPLHDLPGVRWPARPVAGGVRQAAADHVVHHPDQVLAQPRVLAELPRVGELVEDEPAAQRLGRRAGHAGEAGDVRLHQVQRRSSPSAGGARLSTGSYWPSTRCDMIPNRTPTYRFMTPRPSAVARDSGRVARSSSTGTSSRRAMSTLTSTNPCRSRTTKRGKCSSGRSQTAVMRGASPAAIWSQSAAMSAAEAPSASAAPRLPRSYAVARTDSQSIAAARLLCAGAAAPGPTAPRRPRLPRRSARGASGAWGIGASNDDRRGPHIDDPARPSMYTGSAGGPSSQ